MTSRAMAVAHLTPHGLRHSAITIGLDAGVSLRDMQDVARRADAKTTRRYDCSRHALNDMPPTPSPTSSPAKTDQLLPPRS
jgi:site-specific recombinase XerD